MGFQIDTNFFLQDELQMDSLVLVLLVLVLDLVTLDSMESKSGLFVNLTFRSYL